MFSNKMFSASKYVHQTILNRSAALRNHTLKRIINKPANLKTSHTNKFLFNKTSVLFTCGGLSTAGFCFYLNSKSKSIAFCKELPKNVEEVSSNKQEKICSDSNESEKNKSILYMLFHFLKPDLIWLLMSIPSAFLAAYFNIQINLALGDLLNVIQKCLSSQITLPTENFISNFINLIKDPASYLLFNYLSQSLFTFLYLYSLFILSEQTANRMRMALFSKFLSFELNFFDLNNGGNIISALSNDVQEFKSSFKQMVSLGIKNFAQIVGCFYTLYHISPEMTILINIIVIPSMALIGNQVGTRLRKISKKLQIQLGKITDVAFETINNIRTVKMLSIEDILSRKFYEEINMFNSLNSEFSIGFALFQSMTNFSINAIVLLTLLFGGYNLLNGQMSAGNLISFLATTQTIQRSLFQLSLLYGHYIKSSSSLQKICDYLKLESPIIYGKIVPDLQGNIEFKDVMFKYPRRPEYIVLDNMNLKLECGKVTALCGSSGGGKSTIAMLVENLYDLHSGAILVDNVNIEQIDKKWLRKDVIGFISQEPVLFCTSIKENIRYGKPDATDEEIIQAAKLANAHEFINKFPSGYDTIVGQQGTAISGGQRQRIAIARAIIKNPKILILDEATSALDSESEAQVKDALDKVMKGRTVLVIAHRLSTIHNSDQIYVIDDGQIIEKGTHQELLNLKGKYYNLVQKNINKNVDLLE